MLVVEFDTGGAYVVAETRAQDASAEVVAKFVAASTDLSTTKTRGGEKMVDVIYLGEKRNITINFISIEDFTGIMPAYPPLRASNNLLISGNYGAKCSMNANQNTRSDVTPYELLITRT